MTPLAAELGLTEAGFLVPSPCGRVWFVPRAAVRQDYIDFLVDNDGISPAAAAQQIDADPEFVETWFCEQCSAWRDIEGMGRLVVKSTRFKTKAALDNLRGRRNSCDYEVIVGTDHGSAP